MVEKQQLSQRQSMPQLSRHFLFFVPKKAITDFDTSYLAKIDHETYEQRVPQRIVRPHADALSLRTATDARQALGLDAVLWVLSVRVSKTYKICKICNFCNFFGGLVLGCISEDVCM